MNVKFAVYSMIGGLVITLLTGLFTNMPVMLLGAAHYGYPFAWLIRLVIAPEHFPWRVNILNLVMDIVIWSIVVFIIIFGVAWVRKSK
ncbi:hypothetical protein A3K80_05320 [Candidatus Bathyarchaeota archaeon RBG_13_38_9]|nr:MAG: hypothetical protein A3K80_05320 [Candidatus Bathyarchaeota archaeon RBG_13_38_9]